MVEKFLKKVEDNNVEIYNIGKNLPISEVDIEVYTSNFIVNWNVEIEMRNWGIKSIDRHIDSVKDFIHWENTENNESGDIEFDSSKDQFSDFKIEEELEISEYGYISPTGITIDFKHKTIEVS